MQTKYAYLLFSPKTAIAVITDNILDQNNDGIIQTTKVNFVVAVNIQVNPVFIASTMSYDTI